MPSGGGNVGFGTITPAQPLDVVGNINSSTALLVSGTQVVGAQDTGWTAQTATASKADLGASPTVGALASWARSIQDMLAAHGLTNA